MRLDVPAATAAATALAEAVEAFAARWASEGQEAVTGVEENVLAHQLASEPAAQERARGVADLYADLATRSMRSLKDGRKGASHVVESVAIVGHVLARRIDSPPNDGATLGQVVADLVTQRARRSNFPEIEDRSSFADALAGELSIVTSFGLYVQRDADGRHAVRERFQRRSRAVAAPDDLMDEEGNLRLPFPMDAAARRKVGYWLQPDGLGNPLFQAARVWVEADGGLEDAILGRVEPILFKTGG